MSQRPVTVSESFELQELPFPTHDRSGDKQETKRVRKRREKLAKLLEANEMKFSHSLQFNSVPDWSSHYIAYSNLKKLYVWSPFPSVSNCVSFVCCDECGEDRCQRRIQVTFVGKG